MEKKRVLLVAGSPPRQPLSVLKTVDALQSIDFAWLTPTETLERALAKGLPHLIWPVWEGAVVTAASVAAEFDRSAFHGAARRSSSMVSAESFSDKLVVYDAVRRKLESGSAYALPVYRPVQSVSDLVRVCSLMRETGIDDLVLKPRHGAGSVGVRRIGASTDPVSAWLEANESIRRLQAHGRAARVRLDSWLVQERVAEQYSEPWKGEMEFAVEVVSAWGDSRVLMISEKWIMPAKEPFLEPIYVSRLSANSEDQEKVVLAAKDVARHLEAGPGALHLEFRFKGGLPQLIDVGFRIGGGLNSRAYYELSRCWLEQAAINWILDGTEPISKSSAHVAQVMLGVACSNERLVVSCSPTRDMELEGASIVAIEPDPLPELLEVVDPAVDILGDVLVKADSEAHLFPAADEVLRATVYSKLGNLNRKREHDSDVASRQAVAEPRVSASWASQVVSGPLAIAMASYGVRQAGWLWSTLGLWSAVLPIAVALLAFVFLRKVAESGWPWRETTPSVLSLFAVVAAGWGAGEAHHRVQKEEASREPNVELAAQTASVMSDGGESIRLSIRFSNKGEKLLNVAFSRVCLHSQLELDGGMASCTYLSLNRDNGVGIPSLVSVNRSVQDAGDVVSQHARWWCEGDNFYCVQPFSKSTNLPPGQSVSYVHDVPRGWLLSQPPRLFMRAFVGYWPDRAGRICAVRSSGISDALGARLPPLVGAGEELRGSVDLCSACDAGREPIWRIREETKLVGECVCGEALAGSESSCDSESENAFIRNPAR